MTVQRTFVVLLFTILAGCGGGGGSGSSTPSSLSGATAPATPDTAASAVVTSTPPPDVTQSSTPNVQPIVVTTAPNLVRNMLTTSVTLCIPGTTECATINNIQVDTGSQGLRILNSALPANLQTLPKMASGTGTSGQCTVFGSGYTWGSVKTADIRMAGHVAPNASIQVIADPTLPTVPADCAASGIAMLTAPDLRANGILGVGLFAADCGINCAIKALPRWYYSCDTSGNCTPSTQPLAQQVTNPVSLFAQDNNGIVIELPAIADGGAPNVSGSMIFGIGTQANNALGNATVLKANAQSGYVTTALNGNTYASFLDSGSNGLFFPSSTLQRCVLWYCPSSTQSLNATLLGADGASTNLTFSVANSQTLFRTSNYAFSNLAGPAANSFNWGLPFFYGRRIFTAIEASATPAGNGPYYAF
ncbi:DUF3443 domain-containing protein [Paraburkholderia bonniea]|uniref:DUF3443 domain-containing protein n=1 Tax=Paraburkholderia bonniea TaxID=2152891 RepID=UPI0025742232|nr:DUF3443 domain-containing protein [Paraburkholderia bonniea]WJF91081.1 DUF3443 domain-containing protein [Paraburkholderia bonniea]WJF94396.1 DUF3443 domain-containing protein [Paraburkholderia bonniea]